MAKAAGLEPVDWEFESLHPHHVTVRKVTLDLESWVSGGNQLTADASTARCLEFECHSPPNWKRCSTVGRWS